jgi:dihydroorotate dehydrogenase electron transfer subunit
LLRRPFSVYESYPMDHPEKKRRGHFLIFYKKVGKGTQKMSEFKRGQKIDMIGPLGNGFSLPRLPCPTDIVLIGGGVGIVSLYALTEVLDSRRLFVFIGGKTKDDILCQEDFRKQSVQRVFIATEDGSLGYRGTVVDLFLSQKKEFEKNKRLYLYCCGPLGMLKTLAMTLKPREAFCQVSLEARMGCGFGACWGCVVKTKNPQLPYQRVCKEGPVFNLKDILWE